MPLYVWKNKSFAAVCITVFVAWGAFNGVQYFATLTYVPPAPQLYLAVLTGIRFQEVLNKSTTTTSLYFIPCVITGAATNIAAGLLVSRVKANHLALAGALATTIAPILLANMNLEWSYWRAAFWAMCLTPLSADGTSHPLLPPAPSSSHVSVVHDLKSGNHIFISCADTSVGRRGIQHARSDRKFCRFGDYVDCCGECDGEGCCGGGECAGEFVGGV